MGGMIDSVIVCVVTLWFDMHVMPPYDIVCVGMACHVLVYALWYALPWYDMICYDMRCPDMLGYCVLDCVVYASFRDPTRGHGMCCSEVFCHIARCMARDIGARVALLLY
eukprot:5842461-Pyramimonas_sp.AAC.1